MATGRKWRSWLKWSKFYVHQLSWHHIPPDSIQSHPDNPQTPPRHLPDTLQTPQNMAHFDQSEATGRKGRSYFKMSLIWCYQWLVHHTLPDSIQSHSDNPQTHPRHLSDTLQTPQMRHILTKPRKLGENVAVYKNESNWMFINCSHIIPSQTVSTVTQTAHRHPTDTQK